MIISGNLHRGFEIQSCGFQEGAFAMTTVNPSYFAACFTEKLFFFPEEGRNTVIFPDRAFPVVFGSTI